MVEPWALIAVMADVDKARPKSFGENLSIQIGMPEPNGESHNNGEENLLIGGQYSVLRIDDTWHPAEVSRIAFLFRSCTRYSYARTVQSIIH